MLRLSEPPGPGADRAHTRPGHAASPGISAEFIGTPDAPSPRLLTAPTGSASSCSMGRLISDQSLAVVQGVARGPRRPAQAAPGEVAPAADRRGQGYRRADLEDSWAATCRPRAAKQAKHPWPAKFRLSASG